MFGFGRKKREFIAELASVLSDMTNVSLSEVEKFTTEYQAWILSQSLDRGLDAVGGAYNICHKLVERIHVAHMLERSDDKSIKKIPDYILLAHFKFSIMMSEEASARGAAPPPSFLSMILPLKVDEKTSNRTYGDILEELIASDPSIYRK